ncbi:MAG: hypothetical protein R6V10_12035 [bacterium]
MMLKRENLVAVMVAVFTLCWLSLPAFSQNPPETTAPPSEFQGKQGKGACCPGGQPDVKEGQPCTILHRVGAGENLHILAAYYYGDPRAWRRIYNMNKEKLRNPNIIYKDQILAIEVPPCWTPRYNFDEFMQLEKQRREILAKPGRKKTKLVEKEERMEIKKVQIKTGEEEGEEAAEGEGEGGSGEGEGSRRVQIETEGGEESQE